MRIMYRGKNVNPLFLLKIITAAGEYLLPLLHRLSAQVSKSSASASAAVVVSAAAIVVAAAASAATAAVIGKTVSVASAAREQKNKNDDPEAVITAHKSVPP